MANPTEPMYIFSTPDTLRGELRRARVGLSNKEIMNAPQHQRLKDLWIAVRFGLGYHKHVGACLVRLNDKQDDIDFFLKSKGGEFIFQSVLADDPERRMGDDHKPRPNRHPKVIAYAPEKGRIEGPMWIKNKVQQKVDKNYGDMDRLNLLVYANYTAHHQDYASIVAPLAQFQGTFASLWVLTNHQLCSVYSNASLGEIRHLANVVDLALDSEDD